MPDWIDKTIMDLFVLDKTCLPLYAYNHSVIGVDERALKLFMVDEAKDLRLVHGMQVKGLCYVKTFMGGKTFPLEILYCLRLTSIYYSNCKCTFDTQLTPFPFRELR